MEVAIRVSDSRKHLIPRTDETCTIRPGGSSTCRLVVRPCRLTDAEPNSTTLLMATHRRQIQVKFPSRETVFDYWLDPETGSFEQWTKSPYFFSIDYDSRVTPMTQV